MKLLVMLLALIATAQAKPVDITLTENNSVVFNQPVSNAYVSSKTLEIIKKARNGSALYLILDTPGGSVSAGLSFIDTIKALGVPVHTITIFAASMGYQFVQELGIRYIVPSGTLMSHRGAVGGLSGQIPGELNSRINHIQEILSGMSARAAKRVSMQKEAYEAAIVNELWITGENAVDKKHADKVANIKCSKELVEGTYQEEKFTPFGPVKLVFSKCPLVSFPLDVIFDRMVTREVVNKVKQKIEANKRKIKLTF